MSEKKFINGLVISAPHEKAPDFVKAKGWIKRQQLLEYLSQSTEDSINFDVKVSKGGKWYCELNDWKPTKVDEYRASGTVPETNFSAPPAPEDDLPF